MNGFSGQVLVPFSAGARHAPTAAQEDTSPRAALFFLCLIPATVLGWLALPVSPFITPALLLGWAAITLLQAIRLSHSMSTASAEEIRYYNFSARRLIAGLSRHKTASASTRTQNSLRPEILILGFGGIAYLGLSLFAATLPVEALQPVRLSWLLMTALAFWNAQALNNNDALQGKLILILLLSMCTAFIINFFLPALDLGMLHAGLFITLSGMLLLCLSVFVYGLNTRRRQRLYPAAGLCLLTVVAVLWLILPEQRGPSAFWVCVWALMGICWAKCWSQGQRRYSLQQR